MLQYHLDIEKRSSWIFAAQNDTSLSLPYHLSEIGRFYAGQDFYTHRSGKAGYYLLYTHSGSGAMELAGEKREILPAQAILIDCGPEHRYHTVQEPWVHSWMHLDGSGVAAFHPLLESQPVALKEPREFLRRFDELTDRAQHIDVVGAVQVSHGISAMLTAMLAGHLNDESPRNIFHHSGIEEAVRYIQEHYQNPVSIDDITHNVNLSKFHFVRLFRKHVGTTPYHYLIQYRINQSKRLLCTTDLTVGEIARQVGYPSESNYIRQFNSLAGMTPAQYRKSNISYLT